MCRIAKSLRTLALVLGTGCVLGTLTPASQAGVNVGGYEVSMPKPPKSIPKPKPPVVKVPKPKPPVVVLPKPKPPVVSLPHPKPPVASLPKPNLKPPVVRLPKPPSSIPKPPIVSLPQPLKSLPKPHTTVPTASFPNPGRISELPKPSIAIKPTGMGSLSRPTFPPIWNQDLRLRSNIGSGSTSIPIGLPRAPNREQVGRAGHTVFSGIGVFLEAGMKGTFGGRSSVGNPTPGEGRGGPVKSDLGAAGLGAGRKADDDDDESDDETGNEPAEVSGGF